ncbi:MAG: putative toxin-antitoxin system toxin component, PIN family [Rubrobacteraceae bacterium]|nr:putative toxin-antitoxin system toxin component, PIN family [Rubrobacteraceae bacterium]
MRVVLDTNLLLSSLITRGGVPDRVYRAWEGGLFDLLASEWQLRELRRASRYPKLRKYIKPAEADAMIRGIRLDALVLDELPEVDLAPDPDDDPLLATAIAGRADYLVTGDKGVLGLQTVENTLIVTPRRFLEEIVHQGR